MTPTLAPPPFKTPPAPEATGQKLKRTRVRIRYRDRQVHHDDGEGNWLVSYADMMTLLFGFFVILSAFSTPDAGKLEKLKQETSKAMGVKYENPYEDLNRTLADVLVNAGMGNDVQVGRTDEGITIVSRGTLFFDSGSTELKPRAAEMMERISGIIVSKASQFRVIVEGHTDNTPMHSAAFPSNWELSAARASTVVRLLETRGFPHAGLRPIGLADAEPLVPNQDAFGKAIVDNQAQNRRIVIRVLRTLPKRMGATPST